MIDTKLFQCPVYGLNHEEEQIQISRIITLKRKEPAGSPPYGETRYIFGLETTFDTDFDQAIIDEVRSKSNVDVLVRNKVSWGTEVKDDLDGVKKFFVYLDVECEYVSGDIIPSEGIEKIEWVKFEDLSSYDIVPPSRVLFQKLGYMSSLVR